MPRAAVRQQTAKLEGDGHHGHADDETRLRQLGYKQVRKGKEEGGRRAD